MTPHPAPAPGQAAPAGTLAEMLAARTVDERTRVRLGAAADTAPEVLLALAADTHVTVRAAVAMNAATPPEADTLLATDADDRVRALLGRKLAQVAPGLSGPDRARMGQTAFDTLARLVEDEAVRVRAAIADVLKDMPAAPRALILRLARDAAVSVCDPVIRLSPLLTEDDLLTLARSPGRPAAALAVARRPGLGPRVCDAVAEAADTDAIAALLENRSAAIREATLDRLAAGAAGHPGWHAPLVRRPALSAGAARALSEFVATALLDELSSRADLPADLAAELRARLAVRLNPAPPHHPEPDLAAALDEALALDREEALTEDAILAAVKAGSVRRATALLAVAADVPPGVVERAATMRSVKGLVSLVWKAGMTMRLAVPLQPLLAHVAPGAALRPTPNGGFPLAAEEMRFQIDVLSRMGR